MREIKREAAHPSWLSPATALCSACAKRIMSPECSGTKISGKIGSHFTAIKELSSRSDDCRQKARQEHETIVDSDGKILFKVKISDGDESGQYEPVHHSMIYG